MVSSFVLLIATTFLTAADVAKLPESAFDATNTFGMTGVVFRASPRTLQIYLQDKSGGIQLSLRGYDATLKDGDLIEALFQPVRTQIYTCAYELAGYKKIGHGKPPLPVQADTEEIYQGKHDNRLVATSGTIIDAFPDEIDPDCQFLVLASGKAALPVSIGRPAYGVTNEVSWIGTRVCVTGIVSAALGGFRKFNSRGITAVTSGIGLTRGKEDATDPFAAPPFPSPFHLDMQRISSETRPRSLIGKVTAVWDDNNLLLQAERLDMPVIASLCRKSTAPHLGDTIKIVGFPETDTYLIKLRNCRWRQEPTGTSASPVPIIHRLRLHDIFRDQMGRSRFEMRYYGELVNLDGKVQSISTADPKHPTLYIESDGYMAPVNASACPSVTGRIKTGATVNLTGVCLMDIDSIRPTVPFPNIRNVSLVLRSDTDMIVLSEPSWWTPQRLFGLVVALFAALVGFMIWNRFLNRLVNRRSRQLLKEQIARASADLRVGERTRLAVELHDSLSQNLAGVACQITATKRAMTLHPDQALPALEKAEKMLLSSRTELKRCLWDLRSDALEEPDTATAITKTLIPVLGNAKLILRFAVPRQRLSDSALHAILCILRELCSNAVRHGQATSLRIAGALDGNALVFSVNDDGCGFDVAHALGPESGHFGLAGIRERVEHFGGRVKMNSNAETGTYTRISIPLSRPAAQEALS